MALITTTDRVGPCGICYEEFKQNERKYSHIGGENHDGFHRTCLKSWLSQNSTCPYDRVPVNPTALLSNKERLMLRYKPAVNAGLATIITPLFYGAVLATGVNIGRGAEYVGINGRDAVGISALSMVGMLLGAASEMFLPILVGENDWDFLGKITRVLGGVTASSLAIGIGKVNAAFSGLAGGLGVGAFTAKQAKRLLSRIGIHSDSQLRIALGIGLGSFLGLGVGTWSESEYVLMGATPLLAGAAAGILSK